MTVKQLIEKLKDVPQDDVVMLAVGRESEPLEDVKVIHYEHEGEDEHFVQLTD